MSKLTRWVSLLISFLNYIAYSLIYHVLIKRKMMKLFLILGLTFFTIAHSAAFEDIIGNRSEIERFEKIILNRLLHIENIEQLAISSAELMNTYMLVLQNFKSDIYDPVIIKRAQDLTAYLMSNTTNEVYDAFLPLWNFFEDPVAYKNLDLRISENMPLIQKMERIFEGAHIPTVLEKLYGENVKPDDIIMQLEKAVMQYDPQAWLNDILSTMNEEGFITLFSEYSSEEQDPNLAEIYGNLIDSAKKQLGLSESDKKEARHFEHILSQISDFIKNIGTYDSAGVASAWNILYGEYKVAKAEYLLNKLVSSYVTPSGSNVPKSLPKSRSTSSSSSMRQAPTSKISSTAASSKVPSVSRIKLPSFTSSSSTTSSPRIPISMPIPKVSPISIQRTPIKSVSSEPSASVVSVPSVAPAAATAASSIEPVKKLSYRELQALKARGGSRGRY